MRAVILAGGKGSRLHPFTLTIPKPLVPIGDLPILEILIRQLKNQGFDRITLAVGHLASLIEAFVGNGERWGVAIDYFMEAVPLGTVGCLGAIEDLEEDRVLVVNGDTLTDLDIGKAYAAHSLGDAITVCASTRTVDVDFGVIHHDGGYLQAYVEKPTLRYDVSMGINIVSMWAIKKHITAGRRLDMPDLIKGFLDAGDRVRVETTAAFWLDLGRFKDLEEGQLAFETEPARFLPQ